ncbi:hypothetical protein SeMB42_g01346 [Synchytrium endobioticum]|uniref:Kinesin motor domain-containing protein n=1 Tax=Synchytrium endobioticum TaxID=286115 RepID=A0A507DLN3_9FUNG|nr:hypothetical protein SeMB42_g01346 [Synchytrium endobioticum]
MAATAAVKVALRVRPLTARETLDECHECLSFIPNQPQVILQQPTSTSFESTASLANSNVPVKSFTFDHVFPPDASQPMVFEEIARPLLTKYMEGFNCCLFAYGQTGSGKTFSMGTGLDVRGDPEAAGIVPRGIHVLFETLKARQEKEPLHKYSVYLSFLELYNEELVDLLSPRRAPTVSNVNLSSGKPDSWGGITIREDINGNIVWSGVREEEVKTPEELLGLLQKGSLCRTTASTDMNATSSRSHAIFSVILKQQLWVPLAEKPDDTANPATLPASEQSSSDNAMAAGLLSAARDKNSSQGNTTAAGSWQKLTSKFHFVDLAGSERLKRTHAEGDRKKEGIAINQGLLALGNVISALGDETRRASHVPYRDSKLTRLLQDSLGGNSQTMMLACVSPADTNMNETRNTLEYANRAKNIKNRVMINQEWGATAEKDREIRALRSEVSHLRTQLATLRSQGWGGEEAERNAAIASAFHGDHGADVQVGTAAREVLEAKIQKLLLERESAKFELERLQFKCTRLHSTANELAHEAALAAAERDQIIHGIKSASASPSVSPSRKPTGDETQTLGGDNDHEYEETLKASRQLVTSGSQSAEVIETNEAKKPKASLDSLLAAHNPTDVLPLHLVEAYNAAIYDLKLRLAESEDKAAWYHDVVIKLGKPVRGSEGAPSYSLNNIKSVDKQISTRAGIFRGKSQETLSSKGIVSSTSEDSLSSFLSHARVDTVIPEAEGQIATEMDPVRNGKAEDPEVTAGKASISGGDEDDDEVASEASSAATSDMYLLISKIQTDIADHEALASRLARREAEYEGMRSAYESKLRALSDQLVRVERERDMAMTKTRGEKSHEEKPGTLALKTRYEERTKKLASEIADIKRKWQENKKSMTTAKSENEALIRNLKASVNSLKVEKVKVLRKLKEEEMRVRDIAASKEREVARLRRRERQAAEAAKKSERSNHLHKLMLTRRSSEEVHHSQNSKLKGVLALLKRSPVSNRISKPQREPTSPRRLGATRRLPSANNKSASFDIPNSPTPRPSSASSSPGWANALGIQSSACLDTTAPITLRAQFKKQLLDAELLSFVRSKLRQQELDAANTSKARLLGELRELKAERERCVEADASNGIYDKPQYMDERIQQVEGDLATLDARFVEWNADGVVAKDAQTSWDCACNLFKGFEPSEKQVVVELLMGDLTLLMMVDHEREGRVRQAEASAAELGVALATARAAARNAAADYERELERARRAGDDHMEIESTPSPTRTARYELIDVVSNSGNNCDRPGSPYRKSSFVRSRDVSEIPKRTSRPSSPSHPLQSVMLPSNPSSDVVLERPATPTSASIIRSPSWTYGGIPVATQSSDYQRGLLTSVDASEFSLEAVDANSCNTDSESIYERGSSNILGSNLLNNTSGHMNTATWAQKSKKMPAQPSTFTNDVFERLASSHTLASQAKVKSHLGVVRNPSDSNTSNVSAATAGTINNGPPERLSVNSLTSSSSTSYPNTTSTNDSLEQVDS